MQTKTKTTAKKVAKKKALPAKPRFRWKPNHKVAANRFTDENAPYAFNPNGLSGEVDNYVPFSLGRLRHVKIEFSNQVELGFGCRVVAIGEFNANPSFRLPKDAHKVRFDGVYDFVLDDTNQIVTQRINQFFFIADGLYATFR